MYMVNFLWYYEDTYGKSYISISIHILYRLVEYKIYSTAQVEQLLVCVKKVITTTSRR